jgi:energy-coupling factor transport system permease protein
VYTFIKGNSVIHRLDPRYKLLILTLLSILAFFVSLELNIVILSYVFILALLSKTGRKNLFLPRPIMFMVFLIFFAHAFFLHGAEQGLLVSTRILLLFYSAQVLTLTTHPKQILYALKSLGLPHSLAFILATALSFLPELEKESRIIMDAQKSRGLDFNSKNPLTMLKNLIPIIVPLFSNSLKQAQDMALALESKGYGNKN